MTPKQMYDHAEECRRVAAMYLQPSTKGTFMELAISWERMAKDREKIIEDRKLLIRMEKIISKDAA